MGFKIKRDPIDDLLIERGYTKSPEFSQYVFARLQARTPIDQVNGQPRYEIDNHLDTWYEIQTYLLNPN